MTPIKDGAEQGAPPPSGVRRSRDAVRPGYQEEPGDAVGTDRSTTVDEVEDEEIPDLPSDPAAMLALIAAQRETVRERTEPNGSLLFGVWGIAWLIGYSVLYLAFDEQVRHDPAWAFIIFGACLVAAMVVTAVHIGRRVAGVRGRSATVGAMYGWSWAICFVMVYLILTGVARAGASDEVMGVLSNGISALVVAALYMAGGALWQEWRMFALGVWVALVGGAAALVPQPGGYLVMAVAGGGGFLLAAVAVRVYRLWRAGRPA